MARDLALAFDPVTRRFDLALDAGARNLAIDSTPASAMMMAVLCDRRARADDEFPAAPDPTAPPLLDPKRGWWADFLDPLGRRLGSRLWLLNRAKETETTRRTAETMAAEAVADLERDRGLSMLVAARWLRPGVLGLLVRAGATEISVTLGVAA